MKPTPSLALLFLCVGVGGALGSMLRYSVGLWLHGASRGLPWATVLVNVAGSLLAGLVFGLWLARAPDAATLRALLLVGFLGGFTTFSAFSLETVGLLQNGQPLLALANVAANAGFSLLACWLGIALARLA